MENHIMKLFGRFKLGNSLFRDTYQISKSEIKNLSANTSLDVVARRQSAQRLSEFIFSKKSLYYFKETEESFEYETKFLVFSMEEFKTIVEAAIEMMTIEEIMKIKK